MKKKIIILFIVILLFVVGSITVVNFIVNKDVIKTEGIDLTYRIYTTDGVSRWFKNGQVAEVKNKKVTGLESKIKTSYNGHILYNSLSSTNTFDDNDSYDGDIAGNKKDAFFGVKFNLTDELYKKYKIYYRTYNKKDGWLDWADTYMISGDNEVDIEKIQIRILKIDDKLDGETKTPSKGF